MPGITGFLATPKTAIEKVGYQEENRACPENLFWLGFRLSCFHSERCSIIFIIGLLPLLSALPEKLQDIDAQCFGYPRD
jgi:hypothetical protein